MWGSLSFFLAFVSFVQFSSVCREHTKTKTNSNLNIKETNDVLVLGTYFGMTGGSLN